MFKYVHTLPGGWFHELNNMVNQVKLLDPYVDNYLISLIGGLSQKQFGIATVDQIAKDILQFGNLLGENKSLFCDSGGYSIIKGDVSPFNIDKFITCYHHFLENYTDSHSDYIFSLDIPIFLKHPKLSFGNQQLIFNSIKYIYEKNFSSLQKSKEILQQNKDLYKKFIFVWQFKIYDQYQIWKKLYEELFIDDLDLKHFAIGGLVGLRGITGIKFSPFTALLYKSANIIYEKNHPQESIIHILGVYHIHDRFLMSFLDKLLNRYYFKDRKSSIMISYDTINYFVSGLFKLRNFSIPIIDGDDVSYDFTWNLINKIHLMIKEPKLLTEVIENLQLIKDNKKVKNTQLICLLNVCGNVIIDKLIDKIIDDYDLVNLFISKGNINAFKNIFSPIKTKMKSVRNNKVGILGELEEKYPFIFKNRRQSFLLNFQYLYEFHKWWESGRNSDNLENMIGKFINQINFPFKFEE